MSNLKILAGHIDPLLNNNVFALFDSFPEPVFIMDREGIILETNVTFAARFSKSPEECIGLNVYDMLAFDLLMPHIAVFSRKKAEEVLSTGKRLSFDDEQDGLLYRSTVYPVRSSEGYINRLLVISEDVTEYRRKEKEANNGRLFSQAFVEATPGPFCMIDVHRRFTAWNSFMRDEILCKSESEMADTDSIELIHPDDRALVHEKLQNVLSNGLEELAEVKVLMSGGPKFRWFLLKAKRILIDSNPFCIAIGTDIHERKLAEQALELSEKKFRAITEQLDGEVFICDAAGIFTYVSPATEKISGFMPHEMIGHRFTEFLAEDERPTALEGFFEIRSNVALKRVFEHRLTRKNGSLFWGEVHIQKYQDQDTFSTIGLLFDVSRRKRYESFAASRLHILQMAESHSLEELLRTTLDEAERLTESTIGFCHFIEDDPAIPFLQISSSNIQKTLHGMDSDVQHPSLKNVHFWDEAIRKQQAVITSDYSSHDTLRKGFPEGHPEIRRTLVVPMLQGDKVMAILGVGNKRDDYDDDDLKLLRILADIAGDIVARKRAELYANDMQNALTQSQKMELVGQLAGGIAHDFNNLLGVILGNVEMALDRKTLEEPLHDNLQNILTAATRSADLTRQLLAFARKQTVMPIVLELNTLVEKTLSVLDQLLGENISIIWIPDADQALVKADPSQIDQILINLCVNARDAIAGVGTITIEIGKICRHKTLHTPHHPCNLPGDYVTLSVTDTGSGIAREHLPHIFEPFFTTKNPGKGTGLGLSTVYGIVKQSNGYIECSSEPGKGSTFKINLPRHNAEYSEPGERKQLSASDKEVKETILIVEDELNILGLCKLKLEQTGYMVLTATTPGSAILLAEQYRGQIDLLLTDVVMPEMNGCDLVKKLLLVNPALKTLFMSGYSCDVITQQNYLDEGVNFIQKPFSLKSLVMMVKNILHPLP
jgi:two-component system cell cycle sensor histidine kinase/response regulator CckA